MNIQNICAIADTYYIAENKAELNQKFIASSDIIISDGKCSHHVDKDGYIDIEAIKDANYIIFSDQDGNIFLGIYKYIIEPKYKEVIDGLNIIRDKLGMHKHSLRPNKDSFNEYHGYEYEEEKHKERKPELKREEDDILKLASSDLVNINNMVCSECGSNKFNTPFQYDGQWNIKCQCSRCGTVYELVPSKYYMIKSITKYTDTTNNEITVSISTKIQSKSEGINNGKS